MRDKVSIILLYSITHSHLKILYTDLKLDCRWYIFLLVTVVSCTICGLNLMIGYTTCPFPASARYTPFFLSFFLTLIWLVFWHKNWLWSGGSLLSRSLFKISWLLQSEIVFVCCSGSGTTTPVTTTPSTRVPTTTNTRPYSITPSTGGGLGIPSGTGGINPDYTDPSIGFKLQNPRFGFIVFVTLFLPFYLFS